MPIFQRINDNKCNPAYAHGILRQYLADNSEICPLQACTTHLVESEMYTIIHSVYCNEYLTEVQNDLIEVRENGKPVSEALQHLLILSGF